MNLRMQLLFCMLLIFLMLTFLFLICFLNYQFHDRNKEINQSINQKLELDLKMIGSKQTMVQNQLKVSSWKYRELLTTCVWSLCSLIDSHFTVTLID